MDITRPFSTALAAAYCEGQTIKELEEKVYRVNINGINKLLPAARPVTVRPH
jgi:hypothetical protein